jgi:hypothetical protein
VSTSTPSVDPSSPTVSENTLRLLSH